MAVAARQLGLALVCRFVTSLSDTLSSHPENKSLEILVAVGFFQFASHTNFTSPKTEIYIENTQISIKSIYLSNICILFSFFNCMNQALLSSNPQIARIRWWWSMVWIINARVLGTSVTAVPPFSSVM